MIVQHLNQVEIDMTTKQQLMETLAFLHANQKEQKAQCLKVLEKELKKELLL